MIDINVSLLMQVVNFIVLLIVLDFILFKPIMRIIREREMDISSAFKEARAAQERMQELTDRYNASLSEARQKAVAVYNTLYQQGLDAQRDLIAAERAGAGDLLDKARAEIAVAAAAARTDLGKDAERLSQDITAVILGRTA
jgi:F-type H+-transporting ATPase subunit b